MAVVACEFDSVGATDAKTVVDLDDGCDVKFLLVHGLGPCYLFSF